MQLCGEDHHSPASLEAPVENPAQPSTVAASMQAAAKPAHPLAADGSQTGAADTDIATGPTFALTQPPVSSAPVVGAAATVTIPAAGANDASGAVLLVPGARHAAAAAEAGAEPGTIDTAVVTANSKQQQLQFQRLVGSKRQLLQQRPFKALAQYRR